jgi:glutathione S-transferase
LLKKFKKIIFKFFLRISNKKKKHLQFYLYMFQLALKNGLTPDADTVTKVDEAFELLNKFLEEQDWLAGSNITIADFAIVVNVSLTEVCSYQKLTELW